MNIDIIKETLGIIGYKPVEGQVDIWSKKYKKHSNYEIVVDLSRNDLNLCKIDFGTDIKSTRLTTSNFAQAESLVVLECVDRLLDKGYEPNKIILEKDWTLGHKGKGYLDIMVLDSKNKSYLMIECKTPGQEHKKEKAKMFSDGGQLFSYLIQEKTTKYLCLYSSQLVDHSIEYENDIVIVTDEIRNAKNQQEAFEAWNQIFENKGVFEAEASPYDVTFSGILKSDLKDLQIDDGGFIFNRFAEILRRNVVSDKTNAFNKIFNLFLCKIVDEYERRDSDQMLFQWEKHESNETVLLRLNDLYKRGMDKYLGLQIAAVSEAELEKELRKVDTEEGKRIIKQLFIQQKLYTGNEFAFKEVFDKKSFEDNCVVVKEVVKLLEIYRIKYSAKHQFLGDFFEKLLNTGIKQEAGQFFTPIPITRFICKSIPLERIIEEKNEDKEENFLPYVIDYASGSGHFLTEMMSEVNKYVEQIDEDWIKGGGLARKNFNSLKDEYLWAREYVYGIEKDYRLAKTTKISTFLNGDGDANIICGDGLDNFELSSEYKGKLKHLENEEGDNSQFDVLIANPPYSVGAFKNTLKNAKNSFTLFDYLTDQSSEIECLFVERAKQLVKEGGYAGIILPTSILYTGGIYKFTRELLFKYFEVIGVVELGANTFMATNTNTVTLFLKRRSNHQWKGVNSAVDSFFESFKDATSEGIEKVFSKFSETVYDLDVVSYTDFVKGKSSPAKLDIHKRYLKEFEKTSDYKKYRKNGKTEAELAELFVEYVRRIEKEKILYFILTYNKPVVLVKSGEKDIEKEFLGYEFSSRKGYEGIRYIGDTKLYNDDDLKDQSKVNSYILKNYTGEPIVNIDEELKDHLQIQYLHEMIDFEAINFEKKVSTRFIKKNFNISKKWPKQSIDDLAVKVDSGTTAPQEKKYFDNGKYPFIRAGNLNNTDEFGFVEPDPKSFVNDLAVKENSLRSFDKGTLVFPKSGQSIKTNNIGFLKDKAYVVSHLACLHTDNKKLLEYLYFFFKSYGVSNLVPNSSDYPSLNLDTIKEFRVPVPSDKVMDQIIEDMGKLQKREATLNKKIHDLNLFIESSLGLNNIHNSVLLGDYITFEYGAALPKTLRIKGEFPVVGSNGVIGYHNEYLVEGPAIIVGRKGSAGKVTWIEKPCFPIDTTFFVKIDEAKFIQKYVYYLLKSLNLEELKGGMGPGGLNRQDAYNVDIPLLDLGEQKKIITRIMPKEKELETLTLELDNIKIEGSKIFFSYL